jgi:peptidyl-prolyl cis-trans isomerase SurA
LIISLTISYIEEKQIVSPGMKRFYDERREEVRVSHIMYKLGAFPEATLKQAESVLDSIKNGKTFEAMVQKYSQDELSKKKDGDIYWFTAGQIIPAFEAAAYSTPVGEVYPKVVKTKYGYHILKVTDRQPRKYKVRAKHILVKNAEASGNMVDALSGEKPLAKITRIYEEIKNGADFDSLAKEYSDDPGSGAKGGDLGLFERRQMVQPFDEAVFKLQVGEVSEIVKTRFGYHIIKLVEVLEYPSFEKELENLREMYKKSRYEFDNNKFLSGLKTEYNFSLNDALLPKLSVKDNEITLSENFEENETYLSNKDSVLVSVNSKNYTIKSFFEYLIAQRKYENNALTTQLLSDGAKDYSNELLLRKKGSELEKTDKEFASLMGDYQNGIYIFKLQEDEVWNKVKIDSTKLRTEYNKSKENFVIEGKVNFNEIFSRDKERIENYSQMLKDGVDFDSVAFKYTERPGFKAKYGRHGFKNVSDSELSKQAYSLSNAGNFSEIFAVDGGFAVVILRKKVAKSIKTFQEALPELSSSFQESESKRLDK